MRVTKDKVAVIQALRDNIFEMSTALDKIEGAADEGTVIIGNKELHKGCNNIQSILSGCASGLLKQYS